LKSIFKIDLNEAGVTDVKNIVGIPASKAGLATAMPPIVPLTKTLVINLLNSNYVVDGTTTVRQVIAEKIEGLAWGPDLPNGHHVLYVISDNDLYSGYLDGKPLPTQIYAV
jgi:Esterase-like activity of phytase